MSIDTAFLGVENSLGGRFWQSRLDQDAPALAICQKLGVADLVGRVLAGRGVDVDTAADFLNPTLRAYLRDPHVMQDMEKAAKRIAVAIKAKEKITIFGDYDVDGATSSALLRRFLAHLGVNAKVYIPDRITEGYGPNTQAFSRIADSGTSLIVTVDCGTSSFEPMAQMRARGVDVVVLDHHIAGEDLPPAFALVNPNRQDDISGYGQLAAVGVTFMLLVALNRVLRDQGAYGAALKEPDLLQWLDLVALGTVCDVVPLRGLNRAFAAQGLKVLARRQNTGLAALAAVARINSPIDAYHLGFVLGPRINAGGRVGEAWLGTELLFTTDEARAAEISARLDQLNAERKAIEDEVVDEAVLQAGDRLQDNPDLDILVVARKNWHPGVIGIAASRLKSMFNRPAIVIALDETGEGKGSGRSIEGVDLGAAISKAAGQGVILKGGGHKMAGGLSLRAEQVDAFSAFMVETLGPDSRKARARNVLKLDGAITARAAASAELVGALEQAGPFGAGNARPRLVLPAHHVVFADIVGKDHVRCTLKAADGARLQAIAFRAADTPWGNCLLTERQMPLHVAGSLKLDHWQGREQIKLHIEDVALA